MQNLGYGTPLYILPFDHRAFVAQTLFGLEKAENLSYEQVHFMREFKMLTYKGVKRAVEMGVPADYAGVLCEEEFGSEVLIDAKHNGFVTILTVEKSGTDSLEFEYKDFKQHLEKFRPTFAKILIKYNPADLKETKLAQKEKLKIVSDYCHELGIKFLLEVLVNPTDEQLSLCGNSKEEYDIKLRPKLSVEVIKDLQNFGVEPDVWKLEGFDTELEYKDIIAAVKSGGREKVGLVILGRGENEEKVDQWLEIGAKVNGVIGFAVGRTVFWDSIAKFYKGEIGKGEVIETIAENFFKFYKIFTS